MYSTTKLYYLHTHIVAHGVLGFGSNLTAIPFKYCLCRSLNGRMKDGLNCVLQSLSNPNQRYVGSM